jgi:hypothetical protein
MASELQYEYSAISEANSIRLIKPQPSQDASASLYYSLIHKKLSLCGGGDIFGHYVALLYVWGNLKRVRRLWLMESV